MNITVDANSPVPPSAQLIEQVKAAILGGRLKPGDPLPSIRQVANDLALNEKTVAKAYRMLERSAVIQTRGYRGSFVHADAAANCSVDANGWVHDKLKETTDELRAAGASDADIRTAFNRAMNGSRNE